MTAMEWVFWSGVLIVVYVYFGYPLTLALLPSAKTEKRAYSLPFVSIVIAAHNEETIIDASIRNKLSLDYPAELMEVIVVSDASSDRTDEIVKSYDSPRIQLIRQETRQGKTIALNRAVEAARGEIIVVSDANSMYDKDALRHLIAGFADDRVGYVTGKLSYEDADRTAVGSGCGLYMRYENVVRGLESRIGSVIGVNGGIDGVRKTLYPSMRGDQLPDFVVPLRVIEQGYRVTFCREAVVHEETLKSAVDEFNMRVRVCLRSYCALWDMKHLLLPKYGLVSLQIWVHKILRYTIFALLPVLLVTNSLLVSRLPYRIVMAFQVLFYGVAVLGGVLERRVRGRLLLSPFYFVLANLAAGVAFWRFLNGERQVTWTPRKGA